MISPRFARRVASIHKWLGLIVAIQLAIWTGTGLFMASFNLIDVRGEKLVHPPAHILPIDMSRVTLSSADALKAVAEDRPFSVALKMLAGTPVYEIRAQIGVFLVRADNGEVVSPVSEDLARQIATNTWAAPGKLVSLENLKKAPQEASGLSGEVWAAHFEGEGNPMLYISAINGQVSSPRTDLWRTYDFFYGMHLMDYAEHENANTPWTIALALLALTTVLFGVILLIHRFTRGVLKQKETT